MWKMYNIKVQEDIYVINGKKVVDAILDKKRKFGKSFESTNSEAIV